MAESNYEKLLVELSEEFGGFALVPKAESRVMRALGAVLGPLLGRGVFVRSVTTTLGQKVYTPSVWPSLPESERCGILRHERVHLRQMRRYGVLPFVLAYTLFPLPVGLAWCRARLEAEAYEESMRVVAEESGPEALNDGYRDFLVGLLSGPAYGWAWPFKGALRRWYDRARDRIRSAQA